MKSHGEKFILKLVFTADGIKQHQVGDCQVPVPVLLHLCGHPGLQGMSYYIIIITYSVVLWKIQKFDWLMPETKWHSCLQFAMRLVSVAAELPIVAELNKRKQMQSLMTKTFYFLTQLFKLLSSCTSSPDLLVHWFQIVCRSTEVQ